MTELPLRPELRDSVPYGAPQVDVAIRLNTNENPYPPDEALVEAIAAAVTTAARQLNRYPDREAEELRQGLAAYLGHGLGPEQVWAANGSNEVMLQLLQAFGGPGRTALSFAPTYAMYPEYARDTSTRWVVGHRAADFTLDVEHALDLVRSESPSVVFLTSPNNPTGTALPLEHAEAVYEAAAEAVVVVDEAYAEFRRAGTPSALTLLEGRPRLVVTRTMSKAFALAGARLGYLAGDAAVVDALRLVRLPYHLSALTQTVALTALRHADSLLARVETLREERDRTVDVLRHLGLDVAESDANFVLFGTFAEPHRIWQALLDRGVLIRETGPEGWLRVSVGTAAEMEAFTAALEAVLQEVPVL